MSSLHRLAFKSAALPSLALLVAVSLGAPAQAQDAGPGTFPVPCGQSGIRVACGQGSTATGASGTALGGASLATADYSVALGAWSVADEAYTVSVGGDPILGGDYISRRIVNVADGVNDSDASTVGQMNAGDAATLAAANGYADAGDARTLTDANAYADAGDVQTLAAAGAYSDAGDAATLATATARADAGDTRTLATANAYADAGDVRTLASANGYTDQQVARLETTFDSRFRDVDNRLDQVAAMGAAFASMSGNTAGAGTGARNRLVLGIGGFGDETAMSVGYSREISRRTAISAGISFTGGEVMSGGSFGFAW